MMSPTPQIKSRYVNLVKTKHFLKANKGPLRGSHSPPVVTVLGTSCPWVLDCGLPPQSRLQRTLLLLPAESQGRWRAHCHDNLLPQVSTSSESYWHPILALCCLLFLWLCQIFNETKAIGFLNPSSIPYPPPQTHLFCCCPLQNDKQHEKLPEGKLSRAFPVWLTLAPAYDSSVLLTRPAPDSQGHGLQITHNRESADASRTLFQ